MYLSTGELLGAPMVMLEGLLGGDAEGYDWHVEVRLVESEERFDGILEFVGLDFIVVTTLDDWETPLGSYEIPSDLIASVVIP